MEPKKKQDKGIYVFIVIMYLFVLLISLHTVKYMNPVVEKTASGFLAVKQGETADNFFEALIMAMQNMPKAPFDILPFRMAYLGASALVTVLFVLMAAYMTFNGERKKDVLNKNQNGSSEWNTDFKKYKENFETKWENKEETDDPNVILSKNLSLGMRIKELDNQRNTNVMVVGGSGTGKSFRVIKPNVMQMNSSTIITDPSGEILECCGKSLIKNGTTVKVFSTSDMIHSNCYNPFDYVYDENGKVDEAKVSTLIYLFLKNANGAKEKSGDPFWEKSAKALLSAIAYYMLDNEGYPKENINFSNVLMFIQKGKVDEESSSSKSGLDLLMDEEEKMAKDTGRISRAVSNYKTFKLAPPKTANSILITCAVDLQLFDTENVKYLTRTDMEEDTNNIHLDKIGDEKTALFINIPQANGTFDFLVAMLYSQLFDTLYTRGEKISPNKWLIENEYGEPLLTMLDSKEQAEEMLQKLKEATVEKRTTKRGADWYQIKSGKKVIREVMSEDYAKKIIQHAKNAKVKQGKIKLPFFVRCLMDEFANIGEIPDFTKKLATMRKYGISCMIVLQSTSQLKAKYKDDWEGIVGNCDTFIFLGSKELETCKYVSGLLGKATIVVRNNGRSLSSKGGNTSQNFSHTARDLMDPAEVSKLDNKKCIIMIRGLQPFLDDKYSFLEHPRFKETGDADNENKVKKDFMEVYFNSVPVKKKGKTNKKGVRSKIVQNIPIESKRINSKQDLLETIGSKTDEEFLEKISSTPTISVPKPKAQVIKTDTANTAPKPTDESLTFEFGS